jgi:hypothetical protein
LKYSTSEIRERLVDKYRISDYAMMVRSTIHEITKIVSVVIIGSSIFDCFLLFDDELYIYM